jgi:NAD-dependent dihydropyrimidine dehydrogenase PreA subunit
MRRKIIKIDQKKCDGCGVCIPACPEGAIQLIDGKARLISDLCCDGLGACLGFCPQGAIAVEEREAEPYNERKVMENIVTQGHNTIVAHLEHLEEHNEQEFLEEALGFLEAQGIEVNFKKNQHDKQQYLKGGSCPGSQTITFNQKPPEVKELFNSVPSQLKQWPVQMHLISPHAPHFRGSDVLLAADCVAYSMGDFHNRYLKGKTLTIACPKLDQGQDIYLEKLIILIDDSKINTLTVLIMQVPCCSGLLRLAQMAVEKAKRKIPIKGIVVVIDG